MSESSIAVTTGSGKNIHTYDRTISSVLVQDQFTIPGEYPLASYFVQASAVSVATTSDHVLQIMAGSSLNVRIRRIWVTQALVATAAQELTIICLRLTTAGTGGGAITPAKFDPDDAAAGATAQTLPSSKGTESTELWRDRLVLAQGYATTGSYMASDLGWVQMPNTKPIIIKAGTSNGIALKVGTGRASATVDITVEFVETSFTG